VEELSAELQDASAEADAAEKHAHEYCSGNGAAKEKEQTARNELAAVARRKAEALETALLQRQAALPPMQAGTEKDKAQEEVAELSVKLQAASAGADAAEKHAREYCNGGGTKRVLQPVLAAWFKSHLPNPTPSEEEADELCKKADITLVELRGWFNAERRALRLKAARATKKVGGKAAPLPQRHGVTWTSSINRWARCKCGCGSATCCVTCLGCQNRNGNALVFKTEACLRKYHAEEGLTIVDEAAALGQGHECSIYNANGGATAAAATAAAAAAAVPGSSALVQSHSGLVGLVNLGNTCFMNRCGYSAVATRRVERTH
jgi:hypothetical protein